MHFEHLIYSAALAVFIGMLYYRATGRDPSWIIVFSAFAPDIDKFACPISSLLGVTLVLNGHVVRHGDFHNLAALCIYALLLGALLFPLGIRLWEGLLFAGIGFGAHLIEDAIVYETSYALLWPFSDRIYGIGLFDYTLDFYGIADTQVLVVGLILLGLATVLRCCVERDRFPWSALSPKRLLR
jgi:hypothetical protein